MFYFRLLPLLTSAAAIVFSMNVYAQDDATTTTTTVVTTPSTMVTTTPVVTTTTPTVTTTNAVAPAGELPTLISPVPKSKEMIATPSGYFNCFSVKAGWYKLKPTDPQIWIPEHRVCQYANSTSAVQGVAWVESYWACTAYKLTTGECTNWDWKPGHWVKTLEVY